MWRPSTPWCLTKTLHVLIDGIERFATPFCAEASQDTARTVRERLPFWRKSGRVVVFVNDETGVAHIIVR
jgi:hypothetical protein